MKCDKLVQRFHFHNHFGADAQRALTIMELQTFFIVLNHLHKINPFYLKYYSNECISVIYNYILIMLKKSYYKDYVFL